jgi:hypothetical protein
MLTRPTLALHFDCHQSTITNWVRRGLLPPPVARSPSGRPLWSDDVIRPRAADVFPQVDVADLASDEQSAA